MAKLDEKMAGRVEKLVSKVAKRLKTMLGDSLKVGGRLAVRTLRTSLAVKSTTKKTAKKTTGRAVKKVVRKAVPKRSKPAKEVEYEEDEE